MRQLNAHEHHNSELQPLEEFSINNGDARIDVAIVGDEMVGYEIKSDCDSLSRLDSQVRIYNEVFDKIFLVVGDRLVAKAICFIPDWWGVYLSTLDRAGNVRLYKIRPAGQNLQREPLSLARLLWRDEALSILHLLGRDRGSLSKPRKDIYNRLIEHLDINSLRKEVVRKIIKRSCYKVAS